MTAAVISFSSREWLHLACLLTAETGLAWLLLNVFLKQLDSTHAGMEVWIVAMLLVSATVLPRLLHDFGIWGNGFAVVMLLGVAATTLLAIKVTVFPDLDIADSSWLDQAGLSLVLRPNDGTMSVWAVILVSALAWWRGVTRTRPDIDAGLLLFKGGAVLLLLTLIAHTLMKDGASDRHASAAVLVFFAATLSGIAMMRQDFLPWRSGGRWIESVLLPVIAIVAPTALVVGLLSRDLSGMVDLLLDPAIWVLTLVLRIVAFLLVIVAMLMLIPLLWLFSLLPFSNTPMENESSTEVARTAISDAADGARQLPDLLRYIIAIAILAALFAGVARFRLLLGMKNDDSDGDLQTSTVEGSLLKDLRAWLRGFSRDHREPELDPLAELRNDPRWSSTVIVRERYADFLQWTRENGIPRSASMTPDELARLWNAGRGAIDLSAVGTITSIYDAARYGQEPLTETDARQVTEAWNKLVGQSSTALER